MITVIFNLFPGAGTALVETARAGRQAVGVEFNGKCSAVTATRLQALQVGVPHHLFVSGQRGLFTED